MFSSIQIKQEYASIEDGNHQNVVDPQGNVDYTSFMNQSVEYPYHPLPHFWGQRQLHPNQFVKDVQPKLDSVPRQDLPQINQTLPSLSNPNYMQQLASYSINSQNVDNQSQLSQLNQTSIDHAETNQNIASMNPGLLSTPITKRHGPGRPSKSSSSSPSATGGSKKIKCQCEICFKEFGHKSNLFIHMRTHNGERPYKCKQCEKCFTHSGNLAIHMRTHSGERPYACQVCGKMFSHSGNLSTHLRTHSGVKPYKCSVCSKEFRHSGNLSIHERIHSGIKPFQCKVCNKEFYHSGNLTTHMKKHPMTVTVEQCESRMLHMSGVDYTCTNSDPLKDCDVALASDSRDLSAMQGAREELLVENEHGGEDSIDEDVLLTNRAS